MFVPVRSYDHYIPAHIIKQRLEEEGIRVYLKDENTVTTDPILSNALGGIKLMVYSEQLERALELIQGYEHAYQKAGACPVCHSLNVRYINQAKDLRNQLTAFLTWLFGSYAMTIDKVYHCYDCGHEFNQLDDDPADVKPDST